jgi:two-component system alkaline phosphatase synthesis response regulator PhoP
LIILDIMLPKKDGFQICRELRRSGVTTPVLLLTAKTQEAEKVLGLELGADDYVTKPFSPLELRARIKALLRRSQNQAVDVFRFGDCEVHFQKFEVCRAGVPVNLTPIEFKLLSALIRNRGKVLSRDQLLDLVWGADTFITDRVVDTHITNLRKKIEPASGHPHYIINVRGVGYRFDDLC